MSGQYFGISWLQVEDLDPYDKYAKSRFVALGEVIRKVE